MGEFALEECLLPRCYGSHGQRLRRAHRACTNAAVTSGVPVGRGRQLAVWIRPPVGRKRADVQDIAAHDEQQRRVGKPFAGDAFKFRSGAEEHWPYRRRCPPRQQVRSSRNDMFRQELHWATGPKLAGQLPQTVRTEQLSGAKNRTSNAVLLHHAVDGRHVSVSVIVLVKEHGLIQLQFEFASDIDTESHVDFSRLSMMFLIRTVSTSTCMSVSMMASAWRTLAGSSARNGMIRLGSGVSCPQCSHSSSKHAMTASPAWKCSKTAGSGRSSEW